MPMHRKNKAPRSVATHLQEPWFKAQKKRSDKRNAMAKASRRKNRAK